MPLKIGSVIENYTVVTKIIIYFIKLIERIGI